jgi:hypothetical protein
VRSLLSFDRPNTFAVTQLEQLLQCSLSHILR